MHIMYVDESGDGGFPADGAFPDTGGPTRWFVRGGIVLHGRQWLRVHRIVSSFKRSRHLPWNAEIKATHLRAGKGSFAGWPPHDRKQFLLDLLETITRETTLRVLVVAINKPKVDLSKRDRLSRPEVRSLELLLERYNEFLGMQPDKNGVVILDSVESASDENLRYFQSYLLEHSDHLEPRRIVEGAMFMPSHTTNLLQVADVCTNVAYRRFARADRNREEYARLKNRIWVEKVWPE